MTEKSKMTPKEKMLALIASKKSDGRSKQVTPAKNDQKKMRKGPKIYNK